MMFLETTLHDLRCGARILSRNVGSTGIMVVALAVGIGANTAAFTIYRATFARSLDARDPAEMVNVALIRDSGAADYRFSYPDYEGYRDSVRSFSGLIAYRPTHLTLSNAGDRISQRMSQTESGLGRLGLLPSGTSQAEFVTVFVVSPNYFQVLGVAPIQGRSFESIPVPDMVAAPPVLISENSWRRRFAGDPAALGKVIHLNGHAVTVVGITPRDFVGTNVMAPDFWVPAAIEPLLQADAQWLRDRENQTYRMFGRLAPGVSIGQAEAEMNLVSDRLRALHDPGSQAARPATALVWPGSPFPLPLNRYGGTQMAILLIMAAAAMVLVVACANVASLQLARARRRQQELRTRLSLGATRLRVIRQLLTENALLGLLAGAVALVVTWAFLKQAVILFAEALPADAGTLILDVAPDLEIFAYVFGISVAAGILSQLAPAMEGSRWALAPSPRAATMTARSRRLQDVLIAAQVALSLVLLIAGSMLLRSAMRSLAMNPGYDSKHLISLEIQFPVASTYTLAQKAALVGELRTRLPTLPGVAAVTSAEPPVAFPFRTAAIVLDSRGLAADGEVAAPSRAGAPQDRQTGRSDAAPTASASDSASRVEQSILHYAYVEPNYFETLRIPLSRGRSFEPNAGSGTVILSESAAHQMWPGLDPIGRSLRLGPTDERSHPAHELVADGPAYEVIGVARDTRGVEFDDSDTKKIYLPLPESSLLGRPLLIRTRFDSAPVLRSIDALTAAIDPDWMAASTTLEEMLRQQPRVILASLGAGVASALGLLGLFLASLGIYGTVSYIVALRTREVGIRMAMGAQKSHILGLVLSESTRPVLAGLLGGVLLAGGTSYLLRGLLHGLLTIDSISFVGVSLVFLATTLVAAYPPARRAMRVDPMEALRYE